MVLDHAVGQFQSGQTAGIDPRALPIADIQNLCTLRKGVAAQLGAGGVHLAGERGAGQALQGHLPLVIHRGSDQGSLFDRAGGLIAVGLAIRGQQRHSFGLIGAALAIGVRGIGH